MRSAVAWRRRALGGALGALVVFAGACDDASEPAGPLSPSEALTRPPSQATFQQDVSAFVSIGGTSAIAETFYGSTSLRARAGVAKRGTTTPVAWDTHFRMGSVTKVFVSVVVLQLVGEGKLSLDDKVEKWLPGLVRGNGNDGRKASIRNLLQMTSGIPEYGVDPELYENYISPEAWAANWNKQWTPQQLVRIAMKTPPLFPAGTEYSYSNTNFVLAGLIIEKVTGNEWHLEVARRITYPLGLGFTDTYSPEDNPYIVPPFAHGYDLFGTDGSYTDVTFHNTSWAWSAGGLITTTNNLNRFLVALAKGQLLKPAQMTQLKTPFPMFEGAEPGTGYGLGIGIGKLPCGPTFLTHDGSIFGYNTLASVLADGSRSLVASITTTDNIYGSSSFATNFGTPNYNLVVHALCGT